MKIYTTLILLFIMSVQLNAQDIFGAKMPAEVSGTPAFYINGYAFFPDKGIVGYSDYWVHPMSSSGIGRHYIRTIEGIDYSSFRFLSIENSITCDKNAVYYKGMKLDVPLQANSRIIIDSSMYGETKVINGNEIFITRGESVYDRLTGNFNQLVEYEKADKIINDIAFIRNDSLFIYFDRSYQPYPREEFADIESLEKVSSNLYQDSKNLYHLHNGTVKTIKDERIIGKHSFISNTAEERNYGENNNHFLIGKKAFYRYNNKIYNYKLQSYKFIDNSFYFFYNGCLYYFMGNDWTNYPIGVNGRAVKDFNEFEEGLNDENAPQRDYNKVKTLGRHALLYNDTELFYKNDVVSYPAGMDLRKLEYIGFFPYRLYIKLIHVKNAGHCNYDAPILRYNQQIFTVCNKQLVQLKGIKKDGYKDFDLPDVKFFNEYYFTDGKTLYYNHGGLGLNADEYLTSKDIDLNAVKVFGHYFYVGEKLYCNYKPVINKPDLNYVAVRQFVGHGFNWGNKKEEIKREDTDFSFINPEKLKIIGGTEFLTDENYLIYGNNIVGKIDYSSVRIITPYIIEDATHYYCRNLMVEKSKLGIKL